VPKKTKHVQPVYPAEALAQGIRGIVILDIVVDVNGKVASTSVLRSVPGLDEAAIAAARQWEYEPTKIDGKPVSVRLTVPITFSLSLPRLLRDTGVPELRQGVAPSFPAGASSGGTATAEVTLEADGRVASANLLSGEAPWSQALLAALKELVTEEKIGRIIVGFPLDMRGTEGEAARRARHAEKRHAAEPLGPLYTTLDALDACDQFGRIAAYSTPIDLAPGIRATYLDAGHILGSASVLLERHPEIVRRYEPDGFSAWKAQFRHWLLDLSADDLNQEMASLRIRSHKISTSYSSFENKHATKRILSAYFYQQFAAGGADQASFRRTAVIGFNGRSVSELRLSDISKRRGSLAPPSGFDSRLD